MTTLFIIFAIWFALSVPVGVLLGKGLRHCSAPIIDDRDDVL